MGFCELFRTCKHLMDQMSLINSSNKVKRAHWAIQCLHYQTLHDSDTAWASPAFHSPTPASLTPSDHFPWTHCDFFLDFCGVHLPPSQASPSATCYGQHVHQFFSSGSFLSSHLSNRLLAISTWNFIDPPQRAFFMYHMLKNLPLSLFSFPNELIQYILPYMHLGLSSGEFGKATLFIWSWSIEWRSDALKPVNLLFLSSAARHKNVPISCLMCFVYSKFHNAHTHIW